MVTTRTNPAVSPIIDNNNKKYRDFLYNSAWGELTPGSIPGISIDQAAYAGPGRARRAFCSFRSRRIGKYARGYRCSRSERCKGGGMRKWRARKILMSGLLLGLAGAGFCAEGGGRFVFGPDGYAGQNFFARWEWEEMKGVTWYLRPSVDTYSSDFSDRYTTFALGGGMDRGELGAYGEMFVQPESGGYSRTGVYADLSYYPPSPPGAPFYSLGCFAVMTSHEDVYSAASPTTGPPRSVQQKKARDSVYRLIQYDLGVSASVWVTWLKVSGRMSKTFYDKDATAEDRRLPQGVGPAGFPDASLSAGLAVPGRVFYPEARYTRTSYLLGQPTSRSFSLGLTFKPATARFYAGWENYDPGGGFDADDYYSAGLTLPF